MIEFLVASPGNEKPVATQLIASLRATWADLEAIAADRVPLLLGARLTREIDLLVFVELA